MDCETARPVRTVMHAEHKISFRPVPPRLWGWHSPAAEASVPRGRIAAPVSKLGPSPWRRFAAPTRASPDAASGFRRAGFDHRALRRADL